MYKKSVYICISLYGKICWFLVKKYWWQQNSSGVSRDSYIFWIFEGITVSSFTTVEYVWQILGKDEFFAIPLPPPPIREQPQKGPSWTGSINITENIRKALDDENIGRGVFVDLQKAFDTLDRLILLAKLNHYGFVEFQMIGLNPICLIVVSIYLWIDVDLVLLL